MATLTIAGYDVTSKVRNWAKDVFPVLGDLKGQIYSKVPALGKIDDFFKNGADQLLSIVKDVPGWLGEHIATPVSNFLGDNLLEPAREHIVEPISRVGEQFTGAWNKAIDWIGDIKPKIQQAFDSLANFNPFEAGFNLFKKAASGVYNVGKKFGGYIATSTKNLIEAEIRKNPKGAWALDHAVYGIPVAFLAAGIATAAYTTPVMNMAKTTVKTTKKLLSGAKGG